MSSDDEFEISNFEIFEIPDCTPERSIPHNLEITRVSKMESDCKESGQQLFKTDNGSSNQDNIMQMLNLISMDTIQDLQCQMVQNNLKFTAELQKISQENETFRQAVTADVQRLSSMMNTLPPVSVVPSTILISGSMSSPALIIPSSGASSVVPSSTSPQDFQQQMLSMLNNTFSKLTTVMKESKSSDSKADWPKFNGDTKKFKHWHLAIIAQLSLAPWKELYDPTTNTLLKTTTNTSLNEKLYAKILLCLEGQVFQDMVARKHLRANGLLLLTELSQTYRPSHVPEVTAAKTVEFWSTLKRSSHESVDAYYNRFQALLDDLEEAGEPIPIHSAIRQFIFTLGNDFATIQNNYRIGLLPDEWKTTDWPSLLVLCRDYANSVRPYGLKQDSTSDRDGSSFDRSAHHKKVKQWFLNPVKFKAEMEAEQQKHVGKCLYHLTKSHPTCDLLHQERM